MMWMRRVRYWLRSAERRRALREEMELHVEERAAELRDRGLDASEARAEAKRRFGNLGLTAENSRSVWIWPWLDRLVQDVRYSLRVLGRDPKFTMVAVLTLGIGIGANGAVFSVVSTVLLRPLPYEAPEELTVLWTNFGPDLPQNLISGPEYAEMLEFSALFEDIGVAVSTSMTITRAAEPEYVPAAMASGNFFSVLGTDPAYGRLIDPSDDVPGSLVTVISDGLWHRQFGGDPEILGTNIYVDETPRQVIGILPPGFELHYPDGLIPPDVDVWMPLTPNMRLVFGSSDYTEMPRGFHLLSAVGRMRDDVTLAQAQADMDAVAAQIRERSPGEYDFEGWGIAVDLLHADLVEGARPGLLLLVGAVAFVLLIACVNVASLLLARAASREREFALRTALGASGWRVLGQLLTESVTLAVLGGGIGLLLAFGLVRTLTTLLPADLPRMDEISVDLRVVLFLFGVSVVTGVLSGLAPALQTRKQDLLEPLKEGARGATRWRGTRIQSLMVVAEVAFAIVLLIGAGLMIRSFEALLDTDPGYDATGVLTFTVNLPEVAYDFAAQSAFFDQLVERLETLPGVTSAGATNLLPLGGYSTSGTTWVNETTRFDENAAFIEANHNYISPDYFRALSIPLIAGRQFSSFDSATAPRVAIVDEDFARRFWPDDDAIGKEIATDPVDGDLAWWEVVGVVTHARSEDLATPGRENVYFPYGQSRSLQAFGAGMFVALRTESDPSVFVSSVRDAVWALDPDQPIDNVRTMEARVNASLASERFSMLMLSSFAVVALSLAVIGVYGVVSYAVSRRNQEIGIRMALGAAATDVRLMILRQNLWIIGTGLVLGLSLALGLSRLISALLYDVAPHDPATYVGVAFAILIVATAACYLPAVRATRVDPTTVLHEE